MREVEFFHREKDKIICDICPHHCILQENKPGICGGRVLIDGVAVATNYRKYVAMHRDPIEKKPLFHYKPGSQILSVGPNGCNFHCEWCQNCEISQGKVKASEIEPERLAKMATAMGSVGLAYTYAEPFIWYEMLLDAMPLVHENGGVNVIVSNGYIEKEPLEKLIPHIDAANIDLKTINSDKHKKYVGGELKYVKNTIIRLYESGIHIEITHLLVTGVNDSMEEFEELVCWIAELDRRIPLHISRYFPRHKSTTPATSLEVLEQACEKASNSLAHVYLGNVASSRYRHSCCTNCGRKVIDRSDYGGFLVGLDEKGDCQYCGRNDGYIL